MGDGRTYVVLLRETRAMSEQNALASTGASSEQKPRALLRTKIGFAETARSEIFMMGGGASGAQRSSGC
jgi:hypothetical protein